MDFILSALGLIVAVIIGGLLLVGLGIGLVVFLVIAIIIAILASIFFYFVGFDGFLDMVSPDFSATNIPDEFVACLQSDKEVDYCRTEYTSWPKDRNELLSELGSNFKKDLGKKLSSNNWNTSMKEINGKGVIELSRESSYENNPKVTESFTLKKDNSEYKIENFSINYQKGVK